MKFEVESSNCLVLACCRGLRPLYSNMFRTNRTLSNVKIAISVTIRRQLRPSSWDASLQSGARGCSASTTESMDDKMSFPAKTTSFPAQPAVKTSFNKKDGTISATYTPQPWDFDHTGGVPIWKVLHHTGLLYIDMHRHWFTPPKDGPPFADLFFGRSEFLEFSRSYHNQMFPGCSLPHNLRICKIGKTSLSLKQQILETTGNDPIAEGYMHCISVSSKTRRPEPWAAWLTQRYPDLCSAPPVATVEQFGPIVAEPSFVYTVKVAPSDTDLQRHVGHFQYVRYCCDCASFGAETGAYSTITGEMSRYKLKRFELLNLGEARAGDVLTVASWENHEQPHLIKFQIKKGEDVITQCSMRFFTDNSKM